MKKKILIFPLIFLFLSLPAFSKSGFEFGIGSGYIFYGSSAVKDRNKALGDSNQSILTTDALFLLPLNDSVMLSFGTDMTFDFRWKESGRINLIDYAFLAGARAYPGVGGLFVAVDYALGRRSDFISFNDEDDIKHTKWGNGFKFTLGYDFSYHLSNLAPVLCAGLKSMPRGGSRDNIFTVSIKLTRHK